MACCFNGFLNKRFLFSEVRLPFENSLVAAGIIIRLACLLTFPTKLGLPETTLCKYSLDTLRCIRVIWMINGVNHGLVDLDTTLHEPPITHSSLLAARFDVHA